MLPVPEVPLPAHFCSTDARNAFHNNAYRPVVEAARRNNEAAVSYLRQLHKPMMAASWTDTAVLNAFRRGASLSDRSGTGLYEASRASPPVRCAYGRAVAHLHGQRAMRHQEHRMRLF